MRDVPQKQRSWLMRKLKSRCLPTVAVHLALGTSLGAGAAEPPQSPDSATSGDNTRETQLGKISVDAAVDDYKVDQVQSPKYTELLRDTPQTMTVIPAELIQQQGTLLLRDILRENVPGITFGAGEGGSYGDSINIHGFTATNDIAIDGVRQSANTTHTDPFDTQAIEVVQGSSSVYAGVGSLGGTINFVSKLPTATNFANATIGAGTADYGRGTADVNHRIGDPDMGMAVRVNAMIHRNEVADRDVTSYDRWGLAPSFAIGLDTPTRFTLAYLHEHDRNLPEYGIPLRNFAPVPGVNRSNYYGFSNVDVEKIDDDALTGILTHDFNSHVSVRNLTRVEQYDRYSITDAAEGRICYAPGQYPLGTNLQAPGTTLRCGAAGASPLEGLGGTTYTPGGPIGNLRDTRNRIIANQTDLTWRFRTGYIDHTVVVGAALSGEWFWLATGGDYRNPNGSTYLLLPESPYDPNHYFTQPLNLTLTGKARSTLSDEAGYVFDTLKLADHWLLGLGARYEHDKAAYKSWTATPAAALNVPPGPLVPAVTNPLVNDNDLFSYRTTLVYKPVEPGSVYVAFGNSKLPSAVTVNGSCSTNCNAAPETDVTYEMGTKWDLLNERLSLTAAVFRTDRRNYLVASGDPTVPQQQLDGKARVDGEQLGVTGNVTREWAVFANYAHLRSEVLQSVSDYTFAATGIDAQKGNPLANTPGDSANLWTTYEFPRGFTLGYGANYTSWVWATASNATPTALYNRATIPGFVVHNLMASYQVSRPISLQLNVTNLFDKEYFTQLRTVSTTSGWVNPGAGRTVVLTALLSL